MQVSRISTTEELRQLTNTWNNMTQGVPFRTWQWLHSWWDHYGEDSDLYVLHVRDSSNQTVGIAPLFLERTATRGCVLQFLGSGDVCSDYISLLATDGQESSVAKAVADWLASDDGWDLLELTGVDASDRPVNQLAERLDSHGCQVHRRAGMNCWRIELDCSWDEYLTRMSKTHRKQVRRAQRRAFESNRAVLKTVNSESEFDPGMEILIDLHTQRWQSLNEPGCFACPRFSGFLRQAARQLFDAKMLGLHWLELEGRPIAADFQLLGSDTTYAYQAGIDPDALDEEPGRVVNIATIKRAIEDGYTGFDFLRGDEPYKAHWRASPQKMVELRIAANRATSKLRHGIWAAGNTLKGWMKGFQSTANLT